MYGYSLDGFPCYLLWPLRTQTGSFCLLESQTRRFVDIEHAGFLCPLGLRHFYDAFSLRAEVSIRSAALAAFQLQEDDVSIDLVLSRAAVAAKGWAGHQEQPVDQNAHGDESSYETGSSTSRAEMLALNQSLRCLK